MNFSKLFLHSLALTCLSTGAIFAQSLTPTYDAIAGTDGGTNVGNDFSCASGDGAVVSSDIPVEVIIAKKLALAVKLPDGSFTNNPIFSGHIPVNNSVFSIPYNGQSHSSIVNASQQAIKIAGEVYTNSTNNVLEIAMTDFVHESDSTSVIEYLVQTGKFINIKVIDDAGPSATFDSSSPYNFDVQDLTTTDGVLDFLAFTYLDTTTIDPTDRAGRYDAVMTITTTSL